MQTVVGCIPPVDDVRLDSSLRSRLYHDHIRVCMQNIARAHKTCEIATNMFPTYWTAAAFRLEVGSPVVGSPGSLAEPEALAGVLAGDTQLYGICMRREGNLRAHSKSLTERTG